VHEHVKYNLAAQLKRGSQLNVIHINTVMHRLTAQITLKLCTDLQQKSGKCSCF